MQYAIRRILINIPVLLAVTVIIFSLINLAPGDPVDFYVNEEVGIAVKNIRYFGSQPWPFPNSLMVGFIADYADGRINVDKSEIIEAAWYSAQKLPPIPPKISIARQLIDWFAENY